MRSLIKKNRKIIVASIAIASVLTLINIIFELFKIECAISYLNPWQLFFECSMFYGIQYLAIFGFCFLIIFYLLKTLKLFNK